MLQTPQTLRRGPYPSLDGPIGCVLSACGRTQKRFQRQLPIMGCFPRCRKHLLSYIRKAQGWYSYNDVSFASFNSLYSLTNLNFQATRTDHLQFLRFTREVYILSHWSGEIARTSQFVRTAWPNPDQPKAPMLFDIGDGCGLGWLTKRYKSTMPTFRLPDCDI